MKRYIALIVFVAMSLFGFSQTGTVRGVVYDEDSGEPIIYTNVYMKGTSIGTSTDVNGNFLITKIPVGSYTLTITYMGYEPLEIPIQVMDDKIISKKLYIKPSSVQLKQVKITGKRREEARTQTQTSVVKITTKQIKQIPTTGGTPDLAQYIQVLPGVVFTGDQGGQLYIRGGAPVQNKVLLDGMIVYNPFHSIGLFSVFETDIIRTADVYTGGFNAEYGGRISSIMDIRTRNGNRKHFAGKIGASTFGGDILIEGPLKKETQKSPTSLSFVMAAKHSYLKESSQKFYKYVNEDGLPFNFTDIYGKLSLVGNNGSTVNVFGFNFDDKVTNYKSLADFNWNATGGGVNTVIIPSGFPMVIEAQFAYSQYKMAMADYKLLNSSVKEEDMMRRSGINSFNAGLNFKYFLGKNEFKYGFEMIGFQTTYNFINDYGYIFDLKENVTEIGLFVKMKRIMGNLILEPGFRMHYHASLSKLSPEPRLALKYNLAERVRIKLAGGLYSQNLISIRSDRDVVNLFTGYLAGPENLPKKYNGQAVKDNLQKAQHIVLGTEIDLTEDITLNIETYYKKFTQLTNINRNKLFDELQFPDEPKLLTKDFIFEKGDAKGVDFSLSYENQHWYIWLVYSLGKVTREYENILDEIETYTPHYDRRHNVNFVSSYTFGEKRQWEINLRWNFGSGFPFTLTKGYFENLTFNGGLDTDFITSNGEYGIIYDDLNKGRLPDYLRLDIGMKRIFIFNKHTQLEVNANITNAYNQMNLFYIDRISQQKIYQLPLMPSFGMMFRF
jgi:hypothetical protein